MECVMRKFEWRHSRLVRISLGCSHRRLTFQLPLPYFKGSPIIPLCHPLSCPWQYKSAITRSAKCVYCRNSEQFLSAAKTVIRFGLENPCNHEIYRSSSYWAGRYKKTPVRWPKKLKKSLIKHCSCLPSEAAEMDHTFCENLFAGPLVRLNVHLSADFETIISFWPINGIRSVPSLDVSPILSQNLFREAKRKGLFVHLFLFCSQILVCPLLEGFGAKADQGADKNQVPRRRQNDYLELNHALLRVAGLENWSGYTHPD